MSDDAAGAPQTTTGAAAAALGSGLADVAGRIGDRWTVATIARLALAPQSLGDLRRHLDGITQRALMLALRALERDGLAERLPDPTGATVRYGLTARGEALLPALAALAGWAQAHRAGIDQSRRAFDQAQAERAALLPRDLTRPR